MGKKISIVFGSAFLSAVLLVSCISCDIGDVNFAGPKTGRVADSAYGKAGTSMSAAAFEAVDFLAEAQPLVFGTSSNTSANSITRSGSKGQFGEIPDEFAVEVRSTGGAGKIAGSEDGMAFYYREVDSSKNFRLEADFLVRAFGPDTGTPNGQEGWGIMARDFVPQWNGFTMQEIADKNLLLNQPSSGNYWPGSRGGDSNMIMVGGIKRGVRAYWRTGIVWDNVTPLTNGEVTGGLTSGNPTVNAYMDAAKANFGFKPREWGDYTAYAALQDRPDYPFIPKLEDMTLDANQGKKFTYTICLEKTNNGFVYSITYPDGNKGAMYSQTNSVSPEIRSFDEGTVPLFDILNSVYKEKYYVGFFAARNAGVWVQNIKYYEANVDECDPYISPVPDELDATVQVLSPAYYTGNDYLYVQANIEGNLEVIQNNKKIPPDVIFAEWVKSDTGAAVPHKLFTIPIQKPEMGDNHFTFTFFPNEDLPAEIASSGDTGYVLKSKAAIRKNFTLIRKEYNGGTGDIYVDINGSPRNSGSVGSPVDLQTAIDCVQPGQTVIVKNGIYKLGQSVIIPRYNNGRFGAMKTVKAQDRGKVILDWGKNRLLEGIGQGVLVGGDYWEFDGFHIRNTPDRVQGIEIRGKNNKISWLTIYSNGNTGLQISGNSKEPTRYWPSGNIIEYCESFNNVDSPHTDADGFAAKLTVGKDNEFHYCISHNNVDDGWDLFAKKETGAIGVVKLYGCISYQAGVLMEKGEPVLWGPNHVAPNGDPDPRATRNGFKLGGEGIPVPHEAVECLAFGSDGSGFTSNSNPSMMVRNSTAINRAGSEVDRIDIRSGDGSAPNGTATNCVTTSSGSGNIINVVNAKYEDAIGVVLHRETIDDGNEGGYIGLFLKRDANGTPIMDDLYKPAAAGTGAWVFYN